MSVLRSVGSRRAVVLPPCRGVLAWVAVTALAVVVAGCGGAGHAAPAPRTKPVMADMERGQFTVCVLQGGTLERVVVRYDLRRGDTLALDGRLFRQAYPSAPADGYAAGTKWFARDDRVRLRGRRYVKDGLPRVIESEEVVRVGEYRGIPLFAAAGQAGVPRVVYLSWRTGCEVQPYRLVQP